jgi:hypothetical protein
LRQIEVMLYCFVAGHFGPFSSAALRFSRRFCNSPLSMKTKIALFLAMVFTLSVHGQATGRESIGLGAPSGPASSYAPAVSSQKSDWANGQPLRVFDKQIYNVVGSQLWKMVRGEVHYKTADGVLILYGSDGLTATEALKNYPGDAVSGTKIYTLAIRTGTYNWGNEPLPLWDYGTPYSPPPPTPEQIKAAQEAAQKAAQRQKEKQFLAQSNAVRWLQPQATNGDAGAQCSLGLHYLNGEGCETNREQAIYWLTQAANRGDIEASNKLASLKK